MSLPSTGLGVSGLFNAQVPWIPSGSYFCPCVGWRGLWAIVRCFSELEFLYRCKVQGGCCGLGERFQLYLHHLYSDPEFGGMQLVDVVMGIWFGDWVAATRFWVWNCPLLLCYLNLFFHWDLLSLFLSFYLFIQSFMCISIDSQIFYFILWARVFFPIDLRERERDRERIPVYGSSLLIHVSWGLAQTGSLRCGDFLMQVARTQFLELSAVMAGSWVRNPSHVL